MNGVAVGGEGLGAQVVSLLLGAFGSESNVRLRRGTQLATVGLAGWKVGKQLQARRIAARDYTVTVTETDGVYPLLHSWLLDQMPAEDRRSLAVATVRNRDGAISEVGERQPLGRLRLLYDGRKSAVLDVDGHRVVAVLEQSGGAGGDDEEKMMLRRHAKLILSAGSIDGRDAVLAVIDRLATESDQRGPRLHMARYDYWNERKDIPDRPLDTVILRAGQREAIVADLQRFLDSEHLYSRLGIPWHRGYLFHGPPGTGKSSLARALATHFRLDVHFAALSDCKSNQSLLNLVGSVPARSMLLLEDVDVLKAATSREADKPEEGDLSALLNALDGMATPHGLITVMTTNRLDTLDEALLRPGRADRLEHIDYLDRDQSQRLANLIVGRHVPLPGYIKPQLTPADVLEACKPHLHDRASLEDIVVEALRHRQAEVNAARAAGQKAAAA